MHPAPSVIIFTVLSGLGFGYLGFLSAGLTTPTGIAAFFAYGLGYGLAVAGLVASTFHLGNPQRALRAFTQWRTSWLSREGWLSVAALLTVAPTALLAVFDDQPGSGFGLFGALFAVLTILATSMIYAQLRTVPRWHSAMTPVLFMAHALAGGAILAGQGYFAAVLCLGLGAVMAANFVLGDRRFAAAGASVASATGLGEEGQVRLFMPPNTGSNYVMREMVHVVGRKHAHKLRLLAVGLAALAPAVVLILLPSGLVTTGIAAVLHLIGAFAGRWLFFAEAEHVVGLFYGRGEGTAGQ